MKVYFTEGLSQTPGSLPFLENYCQDNDCEGKDYEVVEVKETRKRSGYMLVTAAFQAMIWKSDDMCPVLVEFCGRMIETNPGYMLGLTVDTSNVNGFTLYSDKDAPRMWTPRKKPGNLLHIVRLEKQSTNRKKQTL